MASTVTTKDKVNFFKTTSVISAGLSDDLYRSHAPILEVARQINVSSTFLIANIVADIYDSVNKNARGINEAAIEMLTVYKKNEYNIGEYKELVNNAISKCEENSVSAKVIEKVSPNATGEENMGPALVGQLSDYITKLGKIAREALLDLSSQASGMKGEESVSQIGKKIESMTNAIIVGVADLNREIQAMAQAYNIELRTIDDVASSMRVQTEDISKKKSIKFDTEI